MRHRLGGKTPGGIRKYHGGPVVPRGITRVACKFDGCPAPPYVGPNDGSLKRQAYCAAHLKQKQRGGPLRPYVPRTDLDAAWERWAERRIAPYPGTLMLRHAVCGETMRVLSTHSNGNRGQRYCRCTGCEERVIVNADGTQRDTPVYPHRNRARRRA